MDNQLNGAISLAIHCIDNLIDRVWAILTTCTIVLSELNSALYFIAQVYLIAQLINPQSKKGVMKKVITPWIWFLPWGTLWLISIDSMICKWQFWFLTHKAAIDRSKYPFFPISWITYIRAVHCSSTAKFYYFVIVMVFLLWLWKKAISLCR